MKFSNCAVIIFSVVLSFISISPSSLARGIYEGPDDNAAVQAFYKLDEAFITAINDKKVDYGLGILPPSVKVRENGVLKVDILVHYSKREDVKDSRVYEEFVEENYLSVNGTLYLVMRDAMLLPARKMVYEKLKIVPSDERCKGDVPSLTCYMKGEIKPGKGVMEGLVNKVYSPFSLKEIYNSSILSVNFELGLYPLNKVLPEKLEFVLTVYVWPVVFPKRVFSLPMYTAVLSNDGLLSEASDKRKVKIIPDSSLAFRIPFVDELRMKVERDFEDLILLKEELDEIYRNKSKRKKFRLLPKEGCPKGSGLYNNFLIQQSQYMFYKCFFCFFRRHFFHHFALVEYHCPRGAARHSYVGFARFSGAVDSTSHHSNS